MKHLLTLMLFAWAAVLQAQTPSTHAVTLTWTDPSNPVGTTYSVYRAVGLCSGAPSFSKLAAGINVKTYEDTTVQSGNYCFYVTASFNGMESAPSVSIMAPVPTFPPQQVSFTVK